MLMVINMSVNGKMVKRVDLGNYGIQTEISSVVTGSMIRPRVLEDWNIVMVMFMMVNGKEIKDLVSQ